MRRRRNPSAGAWLAIVGGVIAAGVVLVLVDVARLKAGEASLEHDVLEKLGL